MAIQGYAFEPEDMAKLRAILRRLYAPEALTADARRDLANRMDAVLGAAVELKD